MCTLSFIDRLSFDDDLACARFEAQRIGIEQTEVGFEAASNGAQPVCKPQHPGRLGGHARQRGALGQALLFRFHGHQAKRRRRQFRSVCDEAEPDPRLFQTRRQRKRDVVHLAFASRHEQRPQRDACAGCTHFLQNASGPRGVFDDERKSKFSGQSEP